MHFDHRKHLRTYSSPDTAPGLQERAAPGPKKPAGGSPHINWLHRSLSAGLLLLVPNWAGAQPTAHYCPGSEGLNGASVPPPGIQNKMDAGVAGYYQQKITADSGPNANYNRVAAVGPEISGLIPKTGVEVSLRYLYEFLAENRAQGHTITLTLTKRF